MVAGFWQPEQVELCRPFLDRYVPEVAERWRNSQQVARTLARGLFPSVLVEPSALELVRQAADDMTLDPSFRRLLTEGASDMERTLRTRALDTR